MRSIRQIELDIDQTQGQISEGKIRLRQLSAELAEARLAEAAANPHEWLGRKVERTTISGYRRNAITRKGELRVRGSKDYFNRNPDNVRPGDLCVVSASGQTAYAFGPDWKLAK